MNSRSRAPYVSSGPFHVTHLTPGSRYELRDGHALHCAPKGGDSARAALLGAALLDTDPDVEEVGLGAGYAFGPRDLRAPDVAVGNVPDKPGWITGAPALALEYVDPGQDEGKLQVKVADLLEAGTQWVWVVRLGGLRRVEVHAQGVPVRTFGPGDQLHAPGVLKNPVPVEALYDRKAAHDAMFRNLLQRNGYESLEAVRNEGLREGRARALLAFLAARGIAVPEEARARILACRDAAQLDTWIQRAAVAHALAEVLG